MCAVFRRINAGIGEHSVEVLWGDERREGLDVEVNLVEHRQVGVIQAVVDVEERDGAVRWGHLGRSRTRTRLRGARSGSRRSASRRNSGSKRRLPCGTSSVTLL